MAKGEDRGGRPRKVGATYSRISGANDPREASLDTQEEAQVRFLEEKGFRVPPEFRFRERFTGMESIYDRPVLGQLRDLVASGAVDAMSAYDTDRLARDPRHLLIVVADAHKHGVEPLFVKSDHATEGRIGEMTLYMKGFASALEYDAILDRTTRGRRKLAAKGLHLGAGSVKYGYVWDKETRSRAADPAAAPVVRRIFEALADGMSTASVAAMLNREGIAPPSAHAGRRNAAATWWASCVHRLVRDRTYLGEAVERKTVSGDGRRKDGHANRVRLAPAEQVPLADGRTEALVSPALFARAHRAMASGRTPRGRPARHARHLLSGLIYCGECGARMTPHSNPPRKGSDRRHDQYRCFGRRLKDPTDCRRVAGAGWVEELAWREIEAKLLRPGWLERQATRLVEEDRSARLESDLAQARARRADVDRQVRQLLEAQLALKSGSLLAGALAEKLATLQPQADDLDAHLVDLEGRIATAGSRGAVMTDLLRRVDDVRRRAREGLSRDEKRTVIEALGVDVVVFAGERRVRVRLPWTQGAGGGRIAAQTLGSARQNGTAQPDYDVIVLESEEAA